MPPINTITAWVFVMGGCAMLLRAYGPLLWKRLDRFAFYCFRGVFLMATVAFFRAGYWDGLQWLLGEYWPVVRDIFGGQKASTVFNVLWYFVVRDFMLARLMLVPENERHQWRWWTVWAHPQKRCLIDWRRK